jgi:hypothetical protein
MDFVNLIFKLFHYIIPELTRDHSNPVCQLERIDHHYSTHRYNLSALISSVASAEKGVYPFECKYVVNLMCTALLPVDDYKM